MKKEQIDSAEIFQDHPGEDFYVDKKHEDAQCLQKQDVGIINNNPRNGEGPKLDSIVSPA